MEIVGEPGVGKSRWLDQLRRITADRAQLAAVCERYDSSTPYYMVRRLLRDLLGAPRRPATTTVISSGSWPRWPTGRRSVLPWAPLIAGAMDLSVPETAETRELDEEFRRPRLAQAVIDLLAHLLPDPGLFTIEDAHFMDEASADLFWAPGRVGGLDLLAVVRDPAGHRHWFRGAG